MNYRKYLEESYKEYHYRIKTVVPMDSVKMDKLESLLQKYDLKDVTSPRRTPLQEHPLDFYDIANSEVYIMDATLGMPASSYVMQQELKEILDVPEKYIIVRADNDPLELYTEQLMDEEEYETKLSTDAEYNDNEQIKEEPDFGDAYNEKFLSRIARARIKMETDIADDKAQYNDGHDGVKPYYGNATDNSVDPKRSPSGNYDNNNEMEDKIR